MVCAEGTTRPDGNSPCPWPADTTCDDCWDDYPQEVKDRAITMATSLLWRLSGRQFGCCCITLRPCGEGCIEGVSTYTGWSGVGLTGLGGANDILRPAIIDGKWVNCGCKVDCCGAECEVELPIGPVCDVSEVIIDGVVQPLGLFSVRDGRTLTRHPTIGTKDQPFTVERSDWADAGGTTIEASGVINGIDGGTVVIDNATTTPPPPATPTQWGRLIGQGTSNLTLPVLGTQVTFSIGGGKTVQWTNATLVGGTEFATANENEAYGPVGPDNALITLEFTSLDATFTNDNQFGIGVFEARWAFPDCFPECNDLGKDITEEGTWAVTYSWGSPIPKDGEYITGILSSELAKACTGDKGCRLPRRTQNISRQGVNVQLVDDSDFLTQGLVGLLEVDQWLKSINPYGLRERSRVYSPETMGRKSRVTWKG